MKGKPRVGSVYRCPICGAELSVIRMGKSSGLHPHCCNEPMEFVGSINPTFRCGVCGSEVMCVSGESEKLELSCCNGQMMPCNA